MFHSYWNTAVMPQTHRSHIHSTGTSIARIQSCAMCWSQPDLKEDHFVHFFPTWSLGMSFRKLEIGYIDSICIKEMGRCFPSWFVCIAWVTSTLLSPIKIVMWFLTLHSTYYFRENLTYRHKRSRILCCAIEWDMVLLRSWRQIANSLSLRWASSSIEYK